MNQRSLIDAKPTVAERWIAALAAPAKAAICTTRLTIGVTLELRARLELPALARNLTLAETLHAFLDERFPEAGRAP